MRGGRCDRRHCARQPAGGPLASMELEKRIARRAERNCGLITGTELRAFGLKDGQLHYRVKHRGWAEVLPGVFKLPGAPKTLDTDLVAAKLWLGRRGHFTGPTAGFVMQLHGILAPRRPSVAIYSGSSCDGLNVHRLQPADKPPIRMVNGYPVPPVERVLLDCSAALPPRLAGNAMDDALRRKMTSIRALIDHRDRFCGRGRRGSRTFRELIAARDATDERVRTVFETRMLWILRRIEGLRFQPDFLVRVGSSKYYLDFYLPLPKIGIECHSRKWHDTERARADVVRDRRIRSTGIELLYFSYEDVVLEPASTEQEIRAAVARRLS